MLWKFKVHSLYFLNAQKHQTEIGLDIFVQEGKIEGERYLSFLFGARRNINLGLNKHHHCK